MINLGFRLLDIYRDLIRISWCIQSIWVKLIPLFKQLFWLTWHPIHRFNVYRLSLLLFKLGVGVEDLDLLLKSPIIIRIMRNIYNLTQLILINWLRLPYSIMSFERHIFHIYSLQISFKLSLKSSHVGRRARLIRVVSFLLSVRRSFGQRFLRFSLNFLVFEVQVDVWVNLVNISIINM